MIDHLTAEELYSNKVTNDVSTNDVSSANQSVSKDSLLDRIWNLETSVQEIGGIVKQFINSSPRQTRSGHILSSDL